MTANYSLFLGSHFIASVNGTEYAYEVWVKLSALAEALGEYASMVANEDSEVVAEYDPDDFGEEEPDDIDNDCGFDPYEGCFTWDC